jgi:hypothetical protein
MATSTPQRRAEGSVSSIYFSNKWNFSALSGVFESWKGAPMPDQHDARYKRLFYNPHLVQELLESFVPLD